MKIVIKKESFLKGLEMCRNIVPAEKNIYNICQNVRISAINQQLVFRATDLKASFTHYVPMDGVSIEQEGELLLPAVKLYSLIKEIPVPEITLESEIGKDRKPSLNGLIRTDDGRAILFGEDIQKFPKIPEFKEDAAFQISGENFKKLVAKTVFATSPEVNRYELGNVLAIPGVERIRFVATDGRRLAYCDQGYEGACSFTSNRTIPADGLRQIARMLGTIPATVKFSFVDNHFLFRTENSVLSIRLSDGKFPPYENVIPKDFPHHGKINKQSFLSALKRVNILGNDKDRMVELRFSEKELLVLVHNESLGEAEVKIPIEFTFGDESKELRIRFNPVFLEEALKVVNSSDVEIELKNNRSALFLKDGDDFRYVVLPIRIEEPEDTKGEE